MSKVSGFLKGMATGLVVGATTAIILDPLNERDRKRLAKKTEGVFKNIGSVIDTAVGMMRN